MVVVFILNRLNKYKYTESQKPITKTDKILIINSAKNIIDNSIRTDKEQLINLLNRVINQVKKS